MSDQNTTATEQATLDTNGDATAKLHATREEALANKPADATKHHKPYQITKAGTVLGWLMARGYDNALAGAARIDGYSASLGTKAAPVTKEAAAAKVLEMSDDEFKALVAARRAAAKK